MASRNAIRATVAAAAVLACAAGLTTSLLNQHHVSLDQAQARAMLPAINRYLVSDRQFAGFGGTLDADLRPKVLCDAAILQITPEGPGWQVGMQIRCSEFARRESRLLEQELGYPGIADIATLVKEGGRYEVVNLRVGPPAWDKAWVDSHFSSQTASWILSANPPTAPDPVSEAWKVLNFPAGTPAAQN